MDNNTKLLVDELKGVALDLFRSAAELDRIIQTIECGACMPDQVMNKVFIIAEGMSRLDYVKAKGYDHLWEKENNIWDKLSNKG